MATRECCFLFVLLFSIATVFGNYVIKEKETRSFLHKDWIPIETESQRIGEIKLTFALKQRNLNLLEKIFWQVSDPKSPNYGNYLTFEEVKDLVAPSAQQVHKVVDWLETNGVAPANIEIHESGDFLTAKIDASLASTLLQTEYKYFIHKPTGKKQLKAMESYSLPPQISGLVDFVSGFRLPNLKSSSKKFTPIPPREPKRFSNGPVLVYVNPLDEIAQTTFIPLCKDGTPSTFLPPCKDSVAVKQFNVGVFQSKVLTKGVTIDISNANCQYCNASSGHVSSSCNQYNQQQGFPPNTVYCETTITGLDNYKETAFSLASVYQDLTNSDLRLDETFRISLGKFVTPQEIWNLYNIPSGTTASSRLNSQSVAEFLGQYYSPQDLSIFFQYMGLPDYSKFVSIIGPNNATQPGGEASLDIQYLMGVAGNASTVFWSLGTLHDGQEPFLEWITNVLNSNNPPLVHSISYGDDENSLTLDYMQRINTEFIKAGTKGLSLLFSSGDNGVFGGASFDCSQFYPSFPASSPYVTTVGATLFSTKVTPICEQNFFGLPVPCHIIGETTSSTPAGSRISSGGGFSNVFSMPSYQSSFVNPYVQKLNIPSNYYNATGRAYPDVAALGHNFIVIINGAIVPVDGTSASAPTFAAVVTLLNDLRLVQGKSSLGFLNPLLYGVQSSGDLTAFNDVITGNNSCSELAWVCCKYGFPAAVGWDAVTGLGSPNYAVLSQYI